jgi:hypothetical protein
MVHETLKAGIEREMVRNDGSSNDGEKQLYIAQDAHCLAATTKPTNQHHHKTFTVTVV